MHKIIASILKHHLKVTLGLAPLSSKIDALAQRAWDTLRNGGCIYWMGNGGSATDSQHLAAEFVGRFACERTGLASVALTTDSAILTSVANDYGFDAIFARQVEALCRPGDLLIGLSTSGRSQNVLNAMQRAADLGVYRVGLTGVDGEQLAECCDLCLHVPSRDTARIQEAHMLIGHILCELVEQQAVSDNKSTARC